MLDSQKRLTKPFYALLSLPATAMGFALSVQISALSWILSTKYGLSIEEVGLVWAAGPIAGILGQVIIGVVSDNVWFWNGRRRPFILIGGVLAALMLLALPSIGVISSALGIEGILGVAIAVAVTLDLAINVSFNPTRSIIADVTPEGVERTKGYTWMQTISGSFAVLAYLIGALSNNYVLIYFGAGLVLLLSLVPPFFIKEPRSLNWDDEDDVVGSMDPTARPEPDVLQKELEVSASAPRRSSLREILMTIQPLWGFLLYAFYRVPVRVLDIEVGNHYVEYVCAAITAVLMVKALMAKEAGKAKAEAGQIGFQKVLAAHAFTWVGVQTMFIYMVPFIQDKMPLLADVEMGRVVSWGFLVLTVVSAVLPAFVLEPITEKIGRVRTHMICIAIMAVGYGGMVLFGSTPLLIYFLMGIIGIGWAATVSLPFAIMSQKVDQAKMGLYMGLFNLSVVLPQLVASLWVGEIVSRTEDKNLIFIICAVSLAISALAWMFVREEQGQGEVMAAGGAGH